MGDRAYVASYIVEALRCCDRGVLNGAAEA